MEQDNIYDPHKSRELAIHIAASSPDCSMERVAALMYFADARANRHLSHSITDDDYMQSRFGPTPCNLSQLINDMTNDGDVNACTTMTYTEVKASILPARQPNLGVFTEDQRDLINRVIDDFADATTGDIMHAAEHELSYRLQRPYSQLALYPVHDRRE